MPELPEVQTIVSDLQIIVGKQFADFFSDFPKAIKGISVKDFTVSIKNQKIEKVCRLGKIIFIRLENKKTIAIHLKMTGQLLLNFQFSIFTHPGTSNFQTTLPTGRQVSNSRIFKQNADKILNENKHIHHLLFIKNSGVLAFSDVRKFATISLLEDQDIELIKKNYGADPIADPFPLKQFSLILEKAKDKPLKSVLMENSMILGIGNIYASEILFAAKILPYRKASSLNENEIKKIHLWIKKILAKAIKLRGTSVSDYRDSAGQKGSFQNELKVYKKSGQKCAICDTMIAKMVIGQRSSFYCPKCQS